MKRKDLNEKLEAICKRYMREPERGRRALRLFSKISGKSNNELKKLVKKYDDIFSGLAQSVLHSRGEEITRFNGKYAGAFIIVTDSQEYSFIGEFAGRGSSFEGRFAGEEVSFKGKDSGKNSSFKGEYSGRGSSFKGEYSGRGSSFKCRGAGKNSSFEGRFAGEEVSFKGESAGKNSSFKGKDSGRGSSFEGKDAGEEIKYPGGLLIIEKRVLRSKG